MNVLVLAVLLAAMQSPPVPQKTPNQPTRGTQNVKNNADEQKNASDPSAPIPRVNKDGWDKAYVVFAGLLVIVGALGVGYAVKTLRAIKRQADLMEKQTGILEKSVKTAEENAQAAKAGAESALRSVKLQEAQLRQWIEVREWEVAETIDRDRIWIRCKVVNPTGMPLTIRTVKFWTSYWEMPPVDAQWPVSPRDSYPAQFPGMLWGKFLEDFEKGKLTFSIVLTVDFEDVFGTLLTKRFSYSCECGRERPCVIRPAWGSTHATEAEQHAN